MSPSAVSVVGLSSGYGARVVLKSLSVSFPKGAIIGIIGANGSGKSTLLKAVFGLARIFDGTVFLEGKAYHKPIPTKSISHGLVYVPQGSLVFPDLTVKDNLTVSLGRKDLEHVDERLKITFGFFPRLSDLSNRPAALLSGGEKQQVALAMALMKMPRVLLVDEPTLGLEPRLAQGILQHLVALHQSMDLTIVIVEHRVKELLQVSSLLYGLRCGELVESGTPDHFQNERLRQIFLG